MGRVLPVPSIQWTSDTAFEVDGTPYLSDQYGMRRDTEPTRFCVAKVPRIIDRYAALLADLAPRTIVEVGILEGASTALFADLAQPRKLVAIEYREAPTEKLRAFIERKGLQDVVSVHGGVDQADVERVQAIVDHELGGDALDLLLDDASHLLDPTRATFNALFPRLREGGVYVLEDWGTGLKPNGPRPLQPGEQPLIELVFEIVMAKGRNPRLIRDITVRSGWVTVVRGDQPVTEPFDVRTIGAP
jgi:predicted O-methyltransferase YrrM